MTPLDQAYESFLATSDLASWTASLSAFQPLLDGTEDIRQASPADVRRALTLAVYVAWVCGCCGEDERQRQALVGFRELSGRASALPRPGDIEGRMIGAVIAAAKGYHATARRLLKDVSGPLPVEIAVLTAPDRAIPQAAALKPYVLGGAGGHFAPALYYYGSSLLGLGYQSGAAELLERHPEFGSSSLVIDLRGQLLELAGSWAEARHQYARSEWASHAYRCAVCDLILGEPVDGLAGFPPEMIRRFTAGMLDFSGETDRAGVLRSASFVRACRWNGFDNWLVHFELGRLCFQRRRHAEAEKHLVVAVGAAPRPYRYPIRSLRFANLTWLSEAFGIDMTPETLDAGYAALEEPAGEEQRAHIRTWIGRMKGESAVLDPVLACGDDFERGNGHQLRGNTPDAIACWCSSIAANYTPRAFHALLKLFASYGFEKTAATLAETVAIESGDSFFQLWELAGAIGRVLREQPAGRLADGLFKEQLARIEARMEEFVESEFQNAIRALHYFRDLRRPGPAQRMLARAEALAEGSEELLLLAIARRKGAAGGWDPRAMDALREAERQSTHRFERLLIARELVSLGDIASARVILKDEAGSSGQGELTPIEYVLALQCAKVCLGDQETKRLAQAAVDSLRRDIDAGRFPRCAWRFLERLNRNLVGEPAKISLPARAAEPEAELSGWPEFMANVERFHEKQQSEEELRLLNTQMEALSAAGSLCARFALWVLHLNRFDAQLHAIDRLRPVVADDETPMARDLSLVRRRAKQVAHLWRSHLSAGDASEADRQLDQIRAFFDEEKELVMRWDRLRDEDAEAPSRCALGYAKQGAVLLDEIGSDDSSLWPPFLEIGQAVVRDAKAVAARLQDRASWVRRGTP